MKKAQVTVGHIIAIVTFLTVFVVSMTYINTRFKAENPLEQPLEVKASELADDVNEQITWTVYRGKIKVDSYYPSIPEYPYKVYYSFPDDVDENSITVLDSSKSNIASQHDLSTDELTWIKPLGTADTFYFVFARKSNLSALSYDSNLVNNSASINNSLINVSFSNGGITNIKYADNSLLANGINFSFDSFRTRKGPAYAEAYTSDVAVRVYNNMSKMLFTFTTPTTVYINFTDSFTTQYNGSTYSFNESSQDGSEKTEVTHNGLMNMTDFYDASMGTAIIGENINAEVVNNANEKAVTLRNVTEFILYMRDDNFLRALNEETAYLNPPTILTETPKELTGISEQKYQNFSKLDKSKRKEMLGLEGLDFLLEIEGL